jgi:hypothetical protein
MLKLNGSPFIVDVLAGAIGKLAGGYPSRHSASNRFKGVGWSQRVLRPNPPCPVGSGSNELTLCSGNAH